MADSLHIQSETGLCYLNASQQFTQEDTYQGDINDPMSLNLYNYCQSNPVMYSDPTGHSIFGTLIWPGEIHRAVQLHIFDLYKTTAHIITEAKITMNNGKRKSYGRADLLDTKTGDVWEIKPESTKYSVAFKQINGYVCGKWDGNKNLGLGYGYFIPSNKFQYKDYMVSYRYDRTGIIRYSFYYNDGISSESVSAMGMFVFLTITLPNEAAEALFLAA
jgi:hypothetical protein